MASGSVTWPLAAGRDESGELGVGDLVAHQAEGPDVDLARPLVGLALGTLQTLRPDRAVGPGVELGDVTHGAAWPSALASTTAERIRKAVEMGDVGSLFQLAEDLAEVERARRLADGFGRPLATPSEAAAGLG